MDLNFSLSLIDVEALVIAAMGYTVVFLALVLLFLVFNNLPKILDLLNSLSQARKTKAKVVGIKRQASGEVNAAIGAAIYHYLSEMHDQENMVITINKVAKSYSPWSSKIYSIMNLRR